MAEWNAPLSNLARPTSRSSSAQNHNNRADQPSPSHSSFSNAYSQENVSDNEFYSPTSYYQDQQQPKLRTVGASRPALEERRSFNTSSIADVFGSRESEQMPLGNSGNKPTSNRARMTSQTVGAIGDGRKRSPPSTSTTSSSTFEEKYGEMTSEAGRGGGIFDGRGRLDLLGALEEGEQTTSTGEVDHKSEGATNQAREPGVVATTSLSSTSSSSQQTGDLLPHEGHQSSTNTFNDAPFSSSSLFQSPSSSVDPMSLPPTIDSNSTAPSSTGLSVEFLSTKVTTLEANLTQLSTFINTEVRSLREELGVLRGLVLQSNAVTGRVRGPSGSSQIDQISPLVTLRSPSPNRTYDSSLQLRTNQYTQPPVNYLGLPSPVSSNTTPHTSPLIGTNGHHEIKGNIAPGGPIYQNPEALDRIRMLGQEDKDETIRLLTKQLVDLSGFSGPPPPASMSRSSQLLNNGPPSIMTSGGTGLGMTGTGINNISGPSGMRMLGSGVRGGAAAFTPRGIEERNRISAGFGVVGQAQPAVRNHTTGFDNSTWENTNAPPISLGAMTNSPGSLAGKWEAMGIGADLYRTIQKYGLGPPTKIQAKAIPCILRNQDIVAQAPSIQERIQAYVVPALQLICTTEGLGGSPKGVQVLIVTATVDQAAQCQRLALGLGTSLGIRTSLCVGQGDLQHDLSTFSKSPPHILVGTPQRLLELFSLRSLPVHDIRLLVIDECDQLIARNLSDFLVNLVRLLPPSGAGETLPSGARSPSGQSLPGAFESPSFISQSRFPSSTSLNMSTTVERQTAVFSCTVPQDVLNFVSSLSLREPVRVLVRREGGDSSSPSVRGLRQYYLYIAVGNGAKHKAVGMGRREASNAREWKLEALADLCEDYAFENCVVFCSSVDAVEAVSYKLGARAIEALALHQDMGAPARHAIMSKFRSSIPNRTGPNKRVLVVYDALCRTLTDVSQVPLVINYDLPRAVEDYVHRIACATASGYGRLGVAINIVTQADVEMLRSIESYYRCKILELPANFTSNS